MVGEEVGKDGQVPGQVTDPSATYLPGRDQGGYTGEEHAGGSRDIPTEAGSGATPSHLVTGGDPSGIPTHTRPIPTGGEGDMGVLYGAPYFPPLMPYFVDPYAVMYEWMATYSWYLSMTYYIEMYKVMLDVWRRMAEELTKTLTQPPKP